LSGGTSLVDGSVLDADAVDRAIAGTDVVFHLAAIASVARSLHAPRLTHAVNVAGTIAIVLAAARHRLRRAILAGSSAVYGDPVTLPCREEQRPAPRSPYGVDKLAAEHYLHVLGAAVARRPSRSATSTCSDLARIPRPSTQRWFRIHHRCPSRRLPDHRWQRHHLPRLRPRRRRVAANVLAATAPGVGD
jgi:hypothetical protein